MLRFNHLHTFGIDNPNAFLFHSVIPYLNPDTDPPVDTTGGVYRPGFIPSVRTLSSHFNNSPA